MSSKRIHRTSGEADSISPPFDDRDEIERLSLYYDLEPWEIRDALRYYGSVEEYVRCEKDDHVQPWV